ncbi:MAG: 2,3-diphosphoglycerate-dependent phosphoglycerate mutase [Bacteroidales bacterium]|nr:2,3-diphosphoglycerate-dependent phosphoglycerate mutase [Bacteroidales bacterium]
MKKVVLLRHGESTWNKENRFTGWTDVDLTSVGVEEAHEAARLMNEAGFRFGMAFTSYLKRAIKTLNVVLEDMDLLQIPVEKSWRLNEKHYGMLQGLNKAETAEKYSEEKVLVWRRSYDIAPDEIPADDSRNTRKDPKYADVDPKLIPLTEALKDCIERTLPYWNEHIVPSLKQYDEVIVAAHGNSLRGIIKHLKNISDEDISKLNLPTAMPYVFEFDKDMNLVKDYFLGDPDELAKRMEAVANQGKVK